MAVLGHCLYVSLRPLALDDFLPIEFKTQTGTFDQRTIIDTFPRPT